MVTVLLGRAHFVLPAGKTKSLMVRLTARGRSLVAGAGRVGIKATLKGKGVKSETVRLREARSHKARRHRQRSSVSG